MLSVTEDDSEEEVKTRKRDMVKAVCGANPKLEILCGMTVALALVPEAVAFALSAGLAPSIGLNSAWIIAVFTAVLGGRPGMICGATGSLAVLVGDTVRGDHGHEYLFYAVLLMGILEIVLGFLKIGTLVKLIPTSVMIGFCNGLALVIGLAQINNFKEPEAPPSVGSAESRRLNAFDAFTDDVPFISGIEAVFAGITTALAFFVSLLLPKVSDKVPSALVAIVVCTAFEWGVTRGVFKSHTPIVSDIAALGGNFPIPFWFDSQYSPPPLNLDTLTKVLPLACTMAAVGLLESLMTLNLVDEKTKSKGNATRECIGQGVANIVCGAMGGMGGCAMIGQTMINIGSGARSRLSSCVAGVCLLLIVLVLYPAINIIPVSALVGVMFCVVYHTFEWRSLKLLLLAALPRSARVKLFSSEVSSQKIRRADALIILVVTLVTLFTNLAEAVAVGMLISLFAFALETSDLIFAIPRTEGPAGVKIYDIQGVLFFGSTTRFLELFNEQDDPEDVRLVFQTGYVADFSALEALNKLGERYGKKGKRITVQQLHPRSSKILGRASGLLKEVTLSLDSEEVLPTDGGALGSPHLQVTRIPTVNHSLFVDVDAGSRSSDDESSGEEDNALE